MPKKDEKPKILIVDDNPANIYVMSSALSSLNVTLVTATSGKEALSQLIRHQFAVILLDVQMPEMDGFETAELIMQHEDTHTPIIFVTAYDQDDKFIFKGYEVGAVDYIFKPFDVNVLKSKVSVFIKLYQQKAELSQQKNALTTALNEKENLIEKVADESHKKGVLLNENERQKKQLDKFYRFKLWTSCAALALIFFLAVMYNAHISQQNSELLEHTQELNRLNSYTNQLNEAYKKFIPYDILKLLNRDSIIDVKLGDQVSKDMIVLFVDVRDYSTLSESLTPEENIALINQLIALMQTPIQKHHGIVNKYLGDGLMALFTTHADDAIQAAVAMLKNVEKLSIQRIMEEKSPIRIGIGIDKGQMMVGTVGTEDRMEQTVVADAVNVASRIEGMNKMYGSTLLISEKTFKDIKDPSKYTIRFMDSVKVKGRKKNVIVYQVFDGECSATIDLYNKTMQDFSEGVLLFREMKFSEALHAFDKVLATNKNDTTASIYAERCKSYLTKPLEGDWSHVRTLEHK